VERQSSPQVDATRLYEFELIEAWGLTAFRIVFAWGACTALLAGLGVRSIWPCVAWFALSLLQGCLWLWPIVYVLLKHSGRLMEQTRFAHLSRVERYVERHSIPRLIPRGWPTILSTLSCVGVFAIMVLGILYSHRVVPHAGPSDPTAGILLGGTATLCGPMVAWYCLFRPFLRRVHGLSLPWRVTARAWSPLEWLWQGQGAPPETVTSPPEPERD
jgi:hypothetical protein